METSESAPDKLRDMRRVLRDLVALSTLPAIWTGESPNGIARSLADVLLSILGLDLIYIRLKGKNGEVATEVVRSRQRAALDGQAQQVGGAVAHVLEAEGHDTPLIPDPFGSGMLRTAVVRFGHAGDHGVLLAGSQRPDFPAESDRLLLGVGANQTAIVLQRNHAEQALQKEREWLGVTLASIGDAVIATDTAGHVTFLNAVAQSLTGWTPEEAIGQPLAAVFRILNQETRQPVENPAEKVLRGGRIVGLANHTVLVARDGRECPIDDSAAPIRDKGGEIVGVVLIFRDVTEQRATVEKLRESEARYRSLAQATSSILWTVDEAGRFLVPQPSWSEYTGQTWEQLRDFGWADAIHPDDRARVRKLWQEASASKTPYRSAGRVWHAATRSYRHFEARAVPIANADGVVREWMGTCVDVEHRRQTEEKLRESESRFIQLGDAISQLAWMARPDGNIDWYNSRWYEYTGTTYEQMEGWGWQSVHDPDLLPQVLERWKMSLSAGEPFDMVFPLRGADGKYRPFLTRAMPFRDEHGNLVRWFGTNTDISEQQRIQEELREIAARLSEADHRKDEFLATLAHELRNPLAPIRTGLEAMKLAKGDPASIEAIRGTMERQTLQLITLVDDLLDVSRITQGKLELRTCQVKLSGVVQSAVEASRPFIDEAGHQLTVSVSGEPIYLNADPHRLAQVLSNLLNNAAKYTPEGGRISLSAERRGSDVVVAVKDTGVGIPADMLDRIFEMFAQVERPMERGYIGLGIGLTLVKSLVQMHGGRIDVRSDGLNQGSEFSVWLPILTESPAAERWSGQPGEEAAAAHRRRVLVVDDNKAAAELLGMLVEMLGNEVRTAGDGQEAVAIAAEFLPHLVLMDLGMPRMNGYEAAQHIRRQPWGEEMMLVALTGWGQEDDKSRTLKAGFDRHLVKPAEPSDLQRLFAELQQKPRQQQD